MTTSIGLDEFARIHQLRGAQLMWLLGAGASAAAGVPTASQMVWEFKQLLYSTEQGIPIRRLELADEWIRTKLTDHFARDSRFPAPGSDDEYGAFFEAAWPDVADRRRYIEQKVAGAVPSFGNIGHAILAATGAVPATWTTNFDRVVEDSMAKVLAPPSHLTVATVDTSHIALPAINEARYPALIKLHGDYQSDRLKNTPSEVQEQDRALRSAFVHATQRFGLIVVGFSGRDASVMDALEACLASGSPYPAGLFWCQRSDAVAGARVIDLLERARAAGVDAHLVEIETLDELVGRLMLPLTIPDRLQGFIDALAPTKRRQPFITPPKGRAAPVLRLNALRVSKYPSVCRQLTVEIGGTRAVREALHGVDARAMAVRRRDAVIGYGLDADFKRAFPGHSSWIVGAIDSTQMFRDDSADLGLLYEALARALARCRGLSYRRIRAAHILDVGGLESDGALALKAALKQVSDRWPTPGGALLTGAIGNDQRKWAEAVELRLEQRFGSLWLVFQPTVWVDRDGDPSPEGRAERMDFVRARVEHRYNRAAFGLMNAWTKILVDDGSDVATFGLAEQEGVDAVFRVDPVSAISMTGGSHGSR